MRRLPLILTALMVTVNAQASDVERSFDLDRPAAGVTRIVLEVGVGDVEVIADESGRITAHVEVSASKSWRGSARARRELEAMELESELKGEALHLRMSEHGDDDRHFGEDWTLHVPTGVAIEIEQGVGDLRILDIAAAIEVELGVGDVRIEGEHAAFGSIEGQCGVGDVSLRTPIERTEGSGFIAHTLEAQGPGKAAIDVQVGVGDVDIRLR
jgi:hypothetical protein